MYVDVLDLRENNNFLIVWGRFVLGAFGPSAFIKKCKSLLHSPILAQLLLTRTECVL